MCQHFLKETQLLLVFDRLHTLVLFSLCFLAFHEFYYFCLNIYYGNILLQFGLQGFKNDKVKIFFFLPTSDKSPINNDLGMQLHWMFYKTVNENKLNIWKSQSHRLSSFSLIKKTVSGVAVSSFYSYHYLSSAPINFQCGLNSHKSLFTITAKWFSSTTLFIFFICTFTVFLFLNFCLYILLVRTNEFSLWQHLVLCLISIQEKANKHK